MLPCFGYPWSESSWWEPWRSGFSGWCRPAPARSKTFYSTSTPGSADCSFPSPSRLPKNSSCPGGSRASGRLPAWLWFSSRLSSISPTSATSSKTRPWARFVPGTQRSNSSRPPLHRLAEWNRRVPRLKHWFGIEDRFATEAGWHVSHRNASNTAGFHFPAWRENLILEKYYAPFLDLPPESETRGPHRLSPEQIGALEAGPSGGHGASSLFQPRPRRQGRHGDLKEGLLASGSSRDRPFLATGSSGPKEIGAQLEGKGKASRRETIHAGEDSPASSFWVPKKSGRKKRSGSPGGI